MELQTVSVLWFMLLYTPSWLTWRMLLVSIDRSRLIDATEGRQESAIKQTIYKAVCLPAFYKGKALTYGSIYYSNGKWRDRESTENNVRSNPLQ